MLFDIGQFEHYFSERELRKGLALSEKGEHEFLGKNPPAEYHFFVGREEIFFNRKGNKVLSWHCTCRKLIPCEHLACLMFVLQKGRLNMAIKPGHKKGNAGKTAGRLQVTSVAGRFNTYRKQVSAALRPCLDLPKFSTDDIRVLCKKTDLLRLEMRGKDPDTELMTDLAILMVLLPLFAITPAGMQGPLIELHESVFADLHRIYKKHRAHQQSSLWLQATLVSLKNNQALYSPTFLFLVPRCLNLLSAEEDFESIRQLLYKRKYPVRNSGVFDPIAIIRFMLLVIRHHLSGIHRGKRKHSEPAYYIALAELDTISGRKASALAHLVKGAPEVKKHVGTSYLAYIRLIIEKARERNAHAVELRFLRETFIHGLFIRPEDLQRYLSLLPEESVTAEIDKLRAEIKPSDAGYFDKISQLLLATGQIDEFILEISRRSENFTLLHEAVMMKEGIPDEKLLRNYVKHLLAALLKLENTRLQKGLIDKVKVFFERLPEDKRMDLYEELLMQIGRNKPVYRYIEEICSAYINLPA